jgi:O-antigen/teichoic acid export membrane protein
VTEFANESAGMAASPARAPESTSAARALSQGDRAREPVTRSLKRRALSAAGWSAAGFVLSQVIRVASSLVMTRLLAPEMFGVMAIAITVNVITALLTDLGIQQNIVQSKLGEAPTFLDTAWTVQIVRGLVVWCIALGAAAALYVGGTKGWLNGGTVYATPVLPWVVAASSFAMVIGGFASTKSAVAEREFDQRRLTQIDLISQISSLVSMLALATVSHSIWSLVVGQLMGGVVSTVLSHTMLTGHRNSFAWDRNSLDEIVAFGKWIFFSSFVGVLALYADRLVLGGLVPASVLGQFAIAGTIVGAVGGVFSKLYNNVVMPALSETVRDNRGRLKEVFYQFRLPTDLALLFCAGLLASMGHLVIDVLYDRRYKDAGWMLEILAVSLVWVRYGATQQLYLALGVSKYVAFMNFARLAAVFSALFICFHFGGVKAAIWGFALHQLVIALMTYRFNAILKINDFARDLGVLVALPIGYGVGSFINMIVR